MKITNSGRGIHPREVKGIDRLTHDLPPSWFGFTNLDLVLGAGRAREIDVIVVAERRIHLVDIKDWHGRISSVDGRWHLNGVDKDASPVAKITDIARGLASMLARELKKHPDTRNLPIPKVDGFVVLTGKADRTGIAETERAKVFAIDDFIRIAKDPKLDRQTFGPIAEEFVNRPLTDPFWKARLTPFFNAGAASAFKPGKRRFERFLANDVPSFAHPNQIYCEFDAVDEGNTNNLGTLRLWDFTRCDTRFQSEEGRLEIAGRERQVYHWLRDRSEEAEQVLLTPKIDDPERGVHYWEIYDRRRRLQRLSHFAETEAARLLPAERVELARQVLAALACLHRHDAAHLDLGGHSIWLEAPTMVKFSHLLAARFPEVKSLGNARYQFLASVTVPDDVLGVQSGAKCKDVYLAGVAIHQLLLGALPRGDPPEWDATVDAKSEFVALHHWLAQALEVDASNRFPDAFAALSAFNKATASRPTLDEVIAGLEHFRTDIRTQRQLVSAYPTTGIPILESDRAEIWRSGEGDDAVVVKLWKQNAWGDLKREGSAVLAFLERASDVKADQPAGFPAIRDVCWLGDAFAIIQAWAEGPTLATLLEASPDEMRDPLKALATVKRLLDTLNDVHERHIGHGDLKPANIVVSANGNPIFIDALDFTARIDGDIVSTAYAPETGSIFERDRYAATKIVEEILSGVSLEPAHAARLAVAIRSCREKEPRLSTMLPLIDEIEAVIGELEQPDDATVDTLPSRINISILGAPLGSLAADEGYLFLRLKRDAHRDTHSLVIRGAVEDIEFSLDPKGQIAFARRRNLEQRLIRRFAGAEFHQIRSTLTVVRGDINDFSELLPLLDDPVVKQRLSEATGGPPGPAPAELEDPSAARLADERAEELQIEEIASAPPAADGISIDVARLWRTLMDVENELTIEGIAELESSFDRNLKRHKVPIELESGVFEFARNDTVGVERQDNKGRWRRIGELDVQLSRSELAVIDATDLGTVRNTRLVDAGQRLRFTSHFEVQSLRRRTDAVDRILAGNGRSRGLLSVLSGQASATPRGVPHALDRRTLALYELNPDQVDALDRIIRCRPIGLLQGPPGTGKTRFIAALTHYAITKGLARNVLLSSQSHEAVNTAAEAVLSLFRKTGEQPSLLRVAMDESVVSPPLQAFHSVKVEQSIKDRFRASFQERLTIAGQALGLPTAAIGDIVALETTIRPIAARITELLSSETPEEQRIAALTETLKTHLKSVQLVDCLPSVPQDWPAFTEHVASALMSRYSRLNATNADRIDRLRTAAVIGHDFVGSVSRIQRSFESFLAGTRQIVVGTCVGLGRTALGLTNTAFDLVVVDEAARCTASELLVPLQAARWAVLVGDHAQLEPHHKPEVVDQVAERTGIPKREIRRSDFERVFSTLYGKRAGARLKTQYRMWPPIGALVSETFYPDLTLEPGRTEPEIDPSVLPSSLDKPLIWVETDALGEAAYDRREEDGNSRINRIEASAILALIEDWHSNEAFRGWLQTQKKHPAGIGIICMYSAQRNLIRQRLRQSSLAYLLDQHVKVGTVDSYQGKENPIVLLSLVRNNEAAPAENGITCIEEGFLASPNRINVAASRAMDRLVIIGARRRWSAHGPLGRLVTSFARQEALGHARSINAKELLGWEPVTSQSAKGDTASQNRPSAAKGGRRG